MKLTTESEYSRSKTEVGITPRAEGLYDPRFEHDSCGVGFVVNIKGKRSHKLIKQAFEVALNLLHRGACGCEVNTGDGAGLLIQLPHKFLARVVTDSGFDLPEPGTYGVGMVFLPRNENQRRQIEELFSNIVTEEGQRILGWRDVPTDDTHLGATARSGEPIIRQIFIGRSTSLEGGTDEHAHFERKLYVIRNRVTHAADRLGLAERSLFYIASLSSNTIVYKGMLIADQVGQMFPDLTDPDVESALALVHSRFSTNTFPSWPLAHPYRYVAHNGEINTLRGNINWMRAREALCRSGTFGDDLQKLFPLIREGQSDTATFDNVLEFLVLTGRPLAHAVLMMIPEPWRNHKSIDPERRAFYEYHATLMEPWDGPASIAFTDGTVIVGESNISAQREKPDVPIDFVYLDPPAVANEPALDAISGADGIVIGPGDLYSSILPNLLVEGVPEAIASPIVFGKPSPHADELTNRSLDARI